MDGISFRLFRREDLLAYAAWFDDTEVVRRIDVPNADRVAHGMDPASPAHAVVAASATSDAMLAMLQYDDEPDGGISLLIVLDPAQRGRGVGKRALAAFVAHLGSR